MSASQTIGHRTNAPGLRGHSCGDHYPFTIVGTNFGRSWYVLDAVRGEQSPAFRSQRRAEQMARRCAAYINQGD
jgi:hypothetical protein